MNFIVIILTNIFFLNFSYSFSIKERYSLKKERKDISSLSSDSFNFSPPVYCNGGIGGVTEEGIVYFYKEGKIKTLELPTNFWSNSLCLKNNLFLSADADGFLRVFDLESFFEKWREKISSYPLRTLKKNPENENFYITNSKGEIFKILLREDLKGILSVSKIETEGILSHYYSEHTSPYYICGRNYGVYLSGKVIIIIDEANWEVKEKIERKNILSDVFCWEKDDGLHMIVLNPEDRTVEAINFRRDSGKFVISGENFYKLENGEYFLSNEILKSEGNDFFILTNRELCPLHFESVDIVEREKCITLLYDGKKTDLKYDYVKANLKQSEFLLLVPLKQRKFIIVDVFKGVISEMKTSSTFSSKFVFLNDIMAGLTDDGDLVIYKIIKSREIKNDIIK